MKVAVTGATGHLGNVVCRILVDKGHEVQALYRSESSALDGLDLTLHKGDLSDKKSLEDLMAGCDYVVHSAGLISISGGQDGLVDKVNVEGTRNVLETAIKCGLKKIIHISSVHALVPPNYNTPMNENHIYKSERDYAYDYSKVRGEKIMLKAFKEGKIEGCVIRPSLITGPFDFRPSEIGKGLIDYRNEKIPVVPPGGFDFVDVRDVAKSIVSAITKGQNGEAYMISGQYISMKELTLFIKKAAGVKVPKRVLPFWVMRTSLPFVKVYGKVRGAAPIFTKESIAALKNGHPNIDSSKAKDHLGYSSLPVLETLKDFYEWYDISQNK
jgi:nucleoside-diphosphate-sugar epimerase